MICLLMKHFYLLILGVLFVVRAPLSAEVSLPAIFGDKMVLQQNSEVAIWGWGSPNEVVRVSASWSDTVVETNTDNHATWKVSLKTPAAGGPHTVTISGDSTITLQDVMLGEVWLCSGQSNMGMTALWGINNAEEEIAAANYPDIRLFKVASRAAEGPQIDLVGSWKVCSPDSMKWFSAAGYFFGRKLHGELNVPIGLIDSSWGGTPAECWMEPERIDADETLKQAAAKLSDDTLWAPGYPGATYYSMIAPITDFRIAGVIWYQGEANTVNATAYEAIFTSLIENWRDLWYEDLPFYYAQIAPYKYNTEQVGALVREAQFNCLSIPNTGMVVTSDIGDLDDIHPKNKQDVGLRFANLALAKTYGREDIAYSGPVYREMEVSGKQIVLHFDHAEKGLVAKGGELTGFEIAGKDGQYVTAEAKIDGSTVVVSAQDVETPVAVRFAFSNTAEPNLFNTEGLPASCFRTD